MVRKGFIVKATFEQRLETGKVMNPTNICIRLFLQGSTFKAFEVKLPAMSNLVGLGQSKREKGNRQESNTVEQVKTPRRPSGFHSERDGKRLEF